MLAEDSKPSKEDVATKRLAALGQSSQSVMATAPGLAIVDRENAIANLQVEKRTIYMSPYDDDMMMI
jgi:hypothetical protein